MSRHTWVSAVSVGSKRERSTFVKGSHARLRMLEEEEMGAERTGKGKRKEKKT